MPYCSRNFCSWQPEPKDRKDKMEIAIRQYKMEKLEPKNEKKSLRQDVKAAINVKDTW